MTQVLSILNTRAKSVPEEHALSETNLDARAHNVQKKYSRILPLL